MHQPLINNQDNKIQSDGIRPRPYSLYVPLTKTDSIMEAHVPTVNRMFQKPVLVTVAFFVTLGSIVYLAYGALYAPDVETPVVLDEHVSCTSRLVTMATHRSDDCSDLVPAWREYPIDFGTECYGWRALNLGTGEFHYNSANNFKCVNGQLSFTQWAGTIDCASDSPGTGDFTFGLGQCLLGTPPRFHEVLVDNECCRDPNSPRCVVGSPRYGDNEGIEEWTTYRNGLRCSGEENAPIEFTPEIPEEPSSDTEWYDAPTDYTDTEEWYDAIQPTTTTTTTRAPTTTTTTRRPTTTTTTTTRRPTTTTTTTTTTAAPVRVCTARTDRLGRGRLLGQNFFGDVVPPAHAGPINQVIVDGGSHLDWMRFTTANPAWNSPSVGTRGGSTNIVNLPLDAWGQRVRITGATVSFGNVVDGLQFHLSNGQNTPWFGDFGGNTQRVNFIGRNAQMIGIWGNAANVIERLGFIYTYEVDASQPCRT